MSNPAKSFLVISAIILLALLFWGFEVWVRQTTSFTPKPSQLPILAPQVAKEDGLVLLQGNTLLPISSPTMKMPIYGAVISEEDKAIRVLSGDEMAAIVNQKYPQMARLLLCMIHRESGFNQLALGDKGKAFGAFQIWREVHDLTELEAFDFNFALDWTVERIKEGKGYMWTTHKKCAEENNY